MHNLDWTIYSGRAAQDPEQDKISENLIRLAVQVNGQDYWPMKMAIPLICRGPRTLIIDPDYHEFSSDTFADKDGEVNWLVMKKGRPVEPDGVWRDRLLWLYSDRETYLHWGLLRDLKTGYKSIRDAVQLAYAVCAKRVNSLKTRHPDASGAISKLENIVSGFFR